MSMFELLLKYPYTCHVEIKAAHLQVSRRGSSEIGIIIDEFLLQDVLELMKFLIHSAFSS